MTTLPNCPFCRDNNLLTVHVVAETDGAYLLPARGSEGCYLIVPKTHAETPGELADNWWRDVKTLLAQTPGLPADYNLSFNIGKLAGQTVPHLHLWVIPRAAGQAATGKGLAALVDEANRE